MQKETIISADQSGMLEKLTPQEIERVEETAQRPEVELILRRCILAILAIDHETKDFRETLAQYSDFRCEIGHDGDFLVVKLVNFPDEKVVVDSEMMASVKNLILSAIRDIVYLREKIENICNDDCSTNEITDFVFKFLKSAKIIEEEKRTPDRVVCFGGNNISREEYEYSKEIGYELGLRDVELIGGGGHGVMKAPPKGAAIGYRKQGLEGRRKAIGISESSIIMAEPPNAIINNLVIFPDIEKRLEAFVRASHAAIFFPGGVGTMEELMYLLAILTRPENQDRDLPIILTAHGESGAKYWRQVHEFVGKVFGAEAQSKYQIIIEVDDEKDEREEGEIFYLKNAPKYIGGDLKKAIGALRKKRKKNGEARHFNWNLKIPTELQKKFDPTHENVANLKISSEQPIFERFAQFRRLFSAIVAGHLKPETVEMIEQKGKFQLANIALEFAEPLKKLLENFITDNRMKISETLGPCFEIC